MISRFYSGFEDGGVSLNEIELANSLYRTKYQKDQDTERRKKWHRNGAIKLVLIAIAIGIWSQGFTYFAVLSAITILNLQVIIFNPIIAIKYLNQNFFYVSKEEMWGIPYGNEKLWYFTNLIMAIVFIYYQL